MIPIPQAVAKTLNHLLSAVAQEQGRNRRLASAVVTGGTDERHPAIKQWMSAQRFFATWTHLDHMQDGSRMLPSDEDIVRNLRIAEDVIDARAGLFFANLHSVEDILAEANEFEEGD